MACQGVTEFQSLPKVSAVAPHDSDRPTYHGPPDLKLDSDYEKTFSQWEGIFLCAIINSTRIDRGHVCRIYWCKQEEMIASFGGDLFHELWKRGAIQAWLHQEGYMAVTLTPWCAAVLGFRIAEYWVRYFDRVKEYRGVGRRLARVRVQRWDTEAYWTYRDRPERSIRIPGNTCELPLAGDPEDKRHHDKKEEYLENLETWTFTKNPTKAITITVRVGSFAHKIVIQRDRQAHSHPKNHRPKNKKTHDQIPSKAVPVPACCPEKTHPG